MLACQDRAPTERGACSISNPANAAPLPPMPALPCPADSKVTWGIHREAPLFVDQGVEQTVLTTGIKVSGWAAGWVQDGA
jgi:hypothetical protein